MVKFDVQKYFRRFLLNIWLHSTGKDIRVILTRITSSQWNWLDSDMRTEDISCEGSACQPSPRLRGRVKRLLTLATQCDVIVYYTGRVGLYIKQTNLYQLCVRFVSRNTNNYHQSQSKIIIVKIKSPVRNRECCTQSYHNTKLPSHPLNIYLAISRYISPYLAPNLSQ